MMIEKLTALPNVPFVDLVNTVPVENQEPITWIKNGDTLNGAKTKVGNDGSLNTSGTQIQRNIVQLITNNGIQSTKINECVDSINMIESNLPALTDMSIFTRVSNIENDIEEKTIEIAGMKINIQDNKEITDALVLDVGVYNQINDPFYRPVRDDIVFLKNELGAYPDFDKNGFSSPGSTGTGLKYRVIQNAIGVSGHETRITKLEDEWQLSDVGQMTGEVSSLRSELGNKTLAKPESVYTRLNANDDFKTSTESKISLIETFIGYESGSGTNLKTSIDQLTSDVTENSQSIDSIVADVQALNTQIGDSSSQGSIRAEIEDIKQEQTDTTLILGASNSDGIRGQVVDIQTSIGDDATPGTVKGRLSDTETVTREQGNSITEIKMVLGTPTNGLVASNIATGKILYGDPEALEQFDKDGLIEVVKQLVARVTALE